MKILAILVMNVFALNSFAAVLTPINNDEQQVNVTAVEAVESFKSSDYVVAGRVTTVFRGSAMGFSSVFVTFADSLEDQSYAFEFTYVIGKPQNVSVSKNADGSYNFSMEVTKVKNQDGTEFNYFKETISLKVKKENGEYAVDQL